MDRPERRLSRPGLGGGVASAIRERCLIAAVLIGIFVVAFAPIGRAVFRIVEGLTALLP